MEVIRPLGLDGICSCDGEKISTTDPMRLRIMTTIHVWGDDRDRARSRQGNRRSCRNINLRIKIVGSNITLNIFKFSLI